MKSYQKFAELYDRIFPEKFYRDYERFILRSTGLRSGRLLDVACGTGRLGRRLARRGFDVLGLDSSKAMLDRARGLRTRRASMRSFRVRGPFDLAVCTFDALNHLPRLDGVFRSVARALRPGGWFVFDINSPFKINVLCASYRGRRFRVGRSEVFWLHESRPNEWISRIYIFERGRRWVETIRERAFGRPHVDQALSRAGLKIHAVVADLRGRPLQPTSERWYYVVRKNHEPRNSR